MKEYKYYLTQRPPSLGTHPRINTITICSYYEKTHKEEINCEAWGYVTYKEPLTDKEISDYELRGPYEV